MSCFDIRKPWDEGSLCMTQFEVENYATNETLGKVLGDLGDSCKVADKAINKAMKDNEKL